MKRNTQDKKLEFLDRKMYRVKLPVEGCSCFPNKGLSTFVRLLQSLVNKVQWCRQYGAIVRMIQCNGADKTVQWCRQHRAMVQTTQCDGTSVCTEKTLCPIWRNNMYYLLINLTSDNYIIYLIYISILNEIYFKISKYKLGVQRILSTHF